jgi:hypothetical protein
MAAANLRRKIAMLMICQRDGEDKRDISIPRPQKIQFQELIARK